MQRDMTFHTTKTNTFEERERSLKKANIFRERKKITFECTNNADGDRTACELKGSRVPVCACVFTLLLSSIKTIQFFGRNGLFVSKSVCYAVNPKNNVTKLQI